LPYHNLRHGIRAGIYANRVAQFFAQYGIQFESDIYMLAGGGHDTAVFRKVGVDNPFSSPEELSADITERVAALLGTPEDKRITVRGVILASGADVPCTTDTQRAFRQGDLMAGGLLDSHVAFLNGTYQLYREKKMLDGESPTSLTNPGKLIKELAKFAVVSSDILSTLINSNIDFPDLDYEKLNLPTFAERAESNLRLLTPARITTFLGSHLAEVANYTPVGV